AAPANPAIPARPAVRRPVCCFLGGTSVAGRSRRAPSRTFSPATAEFPCRRLQFDPLLRRQRDFGRRRRSCPRLPPRLGLALAPPRLVGNALCGVPLW